MLVVILYKNTITCKIALFFSFKQLIRTPSHKPADKKRIKKKTRFIKGVIHFQTTAWKMSKGIIQFIIRTCRRIL